MREGGKEVCLVRRRGRGGGGGGGSKRRWTRYQSINQSIIALKTSKVSNDIDEIRIGDNQ